MGLQLQNEGIFTHFGIIVWPLGDDKLRKISVKLFFNKKNRSEIKFICYQHNYYLIKNWIRLHAYNFFKEYDDRYINNIYFDSHDYKAFNDFDILNKY